MQRFALRALWLGLLCIATIGLSVTNASAQTCLGGIGDFVWLDVNQNGLRDAAESNQGINGVVIELRDSAGTLIGTRTTGAAVGSIPGSYLFPFICQGTYTVTIVSGVPAGYFPNHQPAWRRSGSRQQHEPRDRHADRPSEGSERGLRVRDRVHREHRRPRLERSE